MAKLNNTFPVKYILSLALRFKFILFMFFFTIIGTSFLDSFGLAMLFPLFEIILGNESTSELTRILTYPLNLFGIEKNVINICFLILFITANKFVFKLLNTYFSHKLCFEVRAYLMNKTSEYYLSTAYSNIIKSKQGTLINNFVDVPHKATAGMMKLSEFMVSFFMIIFYYGLLFLTNVEITFLLTLISIILYFIFTKLSKIFLKRLGEEQIVFNQNISSIGAESISAIRLVKTFSLKNIIQSNLKKQLSGLIKVDIKYAVFQVLPHTVIELLLLCSVVTSVIIIYNISPELMISIIPTFALFVVVSQRLVGNLNTFIASRTSLNYYIPSISLTKSIIEKNELLKFQLSKKKNIDVQSLNTDIVFDDVSFAYDDKNTILNNLNFKIAKGKVTAIIGESGSGKSTLIDLILALYFPSKGKITLNGLTINDINIIDWRKIIGFVSQDNYLFHNTIMENIRFGNLTASDEDVFQSAKKANAHDFILDLKDGYNTIVGDRGLLISGGQKQRIAIARALIRNPEILIFDEATSALDYKTEKILQEEIIKLSKNKTVLIISHRTETIKNADNILKIENGHIVKV